MASFQQSSPAASPLATVLIPTHKHKNTIQWAIRSVQDQSFSNFELFVVSDGAPPMVRDTVLGIASADSRIRYFEGAKGEGNGEMNRNRALLSAHGQIVCYCADDDLWLSHHLASMVKFLSEVDFGHSRTVEVDEFGRIHSHGGGMDCPAYRDIMRRTWHINPGLTVLGHTMAAYRQVPGGWQPAPPGVPSDLNMIRRFFAVDGLRFGTLLEPSTLRFGLWSLMTRFAEHEAPPASVMPGPSFEVWSQRIKEQGFLAEYERLVAESAARRVGFGIHVDRLWREASVQLEEAKRQLALTAEALRSIDTGPGSAFEDGFERALSLQSALEAARGEIGLLERDKASLEAALLATERTCSALSMQQQALEAELAALRQSSSWRITAPLRNFVGAARRLARK